MTDSYQDFQKVRSLSVVIPAFNEERLIEESVALLEGVLKKILSDYEIIVVDDGSTDSTAKILERLSSKIKRLKYVVHKRNQGLGAAVRKGTELASKEVVLYVDADMPVDYAKIDQAIDLLVTSHADMVFGGRCNRVYDSKVRLLLSSVYNGLIRSIFFVEAEDINFAFKLFRRQALERLELKARGSFISAEIVVKVIKDGCQIQWMGLDYFPRKIGKSRLCNPGAIFFALFEIIQYYPEVSGFKKVDEKILNHQRR